MAFCICRHIWNISFILNNKYANSPFGRRGASYLLRWLKSETAKRGNLGRVTFFSCRSYLDPSTQQVPLPPKKWLVGLYQYKGYFFWSRMKKKTAHSHWSLSLKTGYRFINQKPTFSIWKSIKTGCTYFEISQMLKPWKGDSITSHGVPVTHCEQATILVLKLKVVQLRKFPFFPNVFFSFLLFLSIAWISSESDFLRGVLFPRVCFAPHWVFQRICILNKMHSIDRIYQHDMHSEDSNHIYASWQPT